MMARDCHCADDDCADDECADDKCADDNCADDACSVYEFVEDTQRCVLIHDVCCVLWAVCKMH